MNAPTDLAALKTRQRTAWASGDYAVIGTTLQIVGESLAEACDLRTDERVLDVAAGNGNATLAAARRGCRVTSTDYVGALLERGAERAAAERLQVSFQEADAEALPFDDASFDAVVSTFGVMFAPDHAKSAAELLRVCRPGGRIGLANWTPEGFIGQLFKTLGRHVAPPPGVQSPALWGSQAHLRDLFDDRREPLDRDAHVQLPLSLGGALHRRLPDLVRAGPQGVRRTARRAGRRARARPDRAARSAQPRRPRIAGRARASTWRSSRPGADMEARVQRRVQRYGWDLAAHDYERLWQAQLGPAQADAAGARRAACRRARRRRRLRHRPGLVRRGRSRRRHRPGARRRHLRRDGRRGATPRRCARGRPRRLRANGRRGARPWRRRPSTSRSAASA